MNGLKRDEWRRKGRERKGEDGNIIEGRLMGLKRRKKGKSGVRAGRTQERKETRNRRRK